MTFYFLYIFDAYKSSSVFVRSGSYGNERRSFLTLSDRTETNDSHCLPFLIIHIRGSFHFSFFACRWPILPTSWLRTVFFHPYHALLSPISTISLCRLFTPPCLYFLHTFPVFFAPPCLSFCTPLPVFLRPLACPFTPLAFFLRPLACLYLPLLACLP